MLTPQTSTDPKVIWSYLSTFYNFITDQQKADVETYWKALLDGMEAFNYNLTEAFYSSSLLDSKGYIENRLKEYTITLSDLDVSRYEDLTIKSVVATVPGTTVYEYFVTAVQTLNGTDVETIPLSKYIYLAGNDAFGHTVKWKSLDGITKYNLYRKKSTDSTYSKLTVTSYSVVSGDCVYVDNGDSTETVSLLPTENGTIKYYLFPFTDKLKHLYVPTITTYRSNLTLTQGTDYDVIDFSLLGIRPNSAIPNIEIFKAELDIVLAPIFDNLLISLFGNADLQKFLASNAYQSYFAYNSEEERIQLWCKHLIKVCHAIIIKIKQGLSLVRLGEVLSIYYNVPFAYTAGKVDSINGREVTIGDFTYVIPAGLTITKNVGDDVKQFELLTIGVETVDYLTDPTALQNLTKKDTTPVDKHEYEYYFTVGLKISSAIKALSYYKDYVENYLLKEIIPPGSIPKEII